MTEPSPSASIGVKKLAVPDHSRNPERWQQDAAYELHVPQYVGANAHSDREKQEIDL